jgi:hypothetical protein
MPNTVRFLFTGTALQKVIANSVQVEDIEPGGAATDPPVGSMRLRFRQSDPAGASICPLLPGTMQFLADAAAPGVIPDPDTGPFTAGDVAGWKTRGRILVTVADAVANEIENFAPQLPVKPNRIWYGPVELPPEFFFQTLTAGLRKATIPTATGAVRTTAANWSQHAIAAFLSGQYAPVLESAADAAQDDRVRFVMPTVVVGPAGDAELTITVARAQKPQDAPDETFDDPVPIPPIGRTDPTHPRNGLIPAREVYRHMRPHMVADVAAVALMDAMLAVWPDAPRFFPIRFTRTWELIPNCSAFFPRHTVNVRTAPAVVRQERLPAHGVVYVRQAPAPAGQPAPAAPLVEVWLTGTMKWLLGGGTSWRDPGRTAQVPIDLAAVAEPHISVRLPMSDAMLSDTSRPDPGGMACTYLSLRRTVRALIDNRIAGGRLNFGIGVTAATTRGIIRRAFAGTPASVGAVADNAPDPFGDVDAMALTLEPLLRAFFPDPTPQAPIPGAPANPTVFAEGATTYRLWQSILSAFQDDVTKRNFADDFIGRGAPGAMGALNLAAAHLDPVQNAAEADAAFFDRIVGAILAGLQPGALLQFWHDKRDFVDIKNRAVAGGDPVNLHSYGHSPIFVRYEQTNAGVVTGLRIIDQFGESSCPVTGAPGNRRIQWHGDNQAIWTSANWTE